MTESDDVLRFSQLHIDVARNATDDFNPFHDPVRWDRIRGNPFGSTIVLGFQTAFLVSDRVERRHRGGDAPPGSHYDALGYSNYEFRFVGALRPDEPFRVELRKTVDKTGSGGGLSTRAMVRKQDGTPVLMGTQSETVAPKYLADSALTSLPRLSDLPDRYPIPDSPYFLKRKHLTTSNAKNFVLAGLGRQQDYVDELAEFVAFPPLFCASFASCALLEQARQQGYDFEAEPVVYASHQISVDRQILAASRSNDRLDLLVDGPCASADSLGDGVQRGPDIYRVYGLVHDEALLFRARLQLVRLEAS